MQQSLLTNKNKERFTLLVGPFEHSHTVVWVLLLKKKDDFDVATTMNYGVTWFSSWSRSMCNFETGIVRTKGSVHYCLLSQVNTLNWHGQVCCHLSPSSQPWGSHYDWADHKW